jgi:hypothetical protein
VARHLNRLSKPGYGLIAETVNPVTDRKTYGPKASATPPESGDSDTAGADVVNLASRRGATRAKSSTGPRGDD